MWCGPPKVYLLWRSGGLEWSNDAQNYAGGSVATGRASHARQVKGDDPDKRGHPGPPGWGMGVGPTTPSFKNKKRLRSSKDCMSEEEEEAYKNCIFV